MNDSNFNVSNKKAKNCICVFQKCPTLSDLEELNLFKN